MLEGWAGGNGKRERSYGCTVGSNYSWAGHRGFTDELRIIGYLWDPFHATSDDTSRPCSSCPFQRLGGRHRAWRSSSPEDSGPSTACVQTHWTHWPHMEGKKLTWVQDPRSDWGQTPGPESKPEAGPECPRWLRWQKTEEAQVSVRGGLCLCSHQSMLGTVQAASAHIILTETLPGVFVWSLSYRWGKGLREEEGLTLGHVAGGCGAGQVWFPVLMSKVWVANTTGRLFF